MFNLAKRTFSGHHIQKSSRYPLCASFFTHDFQKNWGRGLPRAGKDGLCNKAFLTDFGLVWILDVYGNYILDGLFGQEELLFGGI